MKNIGGLCFLALFVLGWVLFVWQASYYYNSKKKLRAMQLNVLYLQQEVSGCLENADTPVSWQPMGVTRHLKGE